MWNCPNYPKWEWDGIIGLKHSVLFKIIIRNNIYQTWHFFTGFIGDPAGQLKTLANSFEFVMVPITLQVKKNVCKTLVGNSFYLNVNQLWLK